MSKHVFSFKVFRKKFLLMLSGVLIALLVLYGFAVLYFQSNWLGEFHIAANRAHNQTESYIRAYRELSQAQIAELQGNQQLLADMTVLLESRTEENYITRRKANSLGTLSTIRSFPAFMQRMVLHNGVPLKYVTIHKDGDISCVSLEDANQPEIQYNISVQDLPQKAEHYSIQYAIYNPRNQFKLMGNIVFWFGLEQIEKTFSYVSAQGVVIANDNNELISLVGNKQINKEVLHEIQRKGDSVGELQKDGRRISYTMFESTLMGGSVVTFTDESVFFAEKYPLLLATLSCFMALIAVFILFSYSNLRHDARFIHQILQRFDDVKTGNFSTPVREIKKAPQNEYELIYRELSQMCEELGRYIEVAYGLKIKQQQASMLAMQTQINPHFLYNTLETIRAGALLNNDENTASSIALLGSIYRDIIKQNDVVSLYEELNLLERYLKLMQLRHPDNFIYQIDVSECCTRLHTPKFWMQPLAENFFKHGFRNESGFNILMVRDRVIKDNLYLIIGNNGESMSAIKLAEINQNLKEEPLDVSTSIGLSNVYTRLRYFYGDAFDMKIFNNIEGGIKIIVKLPLSEVGSES